MARDQTEAADSGSIRNTQPNTVFKFRAASYPEGATLPNLLRKRFAAVSGAFADDGQVPLRAR